MRSTSRLPRRPTRTPRLALLLAVLAAACGGDDTVAPDASLAPLVGDWEATVLRLTNIANPSVSPDLIQEGATFTLNVQPSGQYTAILVYLSQDATEIGQVEVNGSQITLTPTVPPGPPTTGTYSVQGDRFTLEGQTEFDFNFDGIPEAADVRFEFVRS